MKKLKTYEQFTTENTSGEKIVEDYNEKKEETPTEQPKEEIKESAFMESYDDYVTEAKKIKESEDGGLSRAGHYALGLKQVRIVISGDNLGKVKDKILRDLKKHDSNSSCDYYEKTGKIVGTYAKAKMDNIKRDLKAIDPKITIEIKDQKLK